MWMAAAPGAVWWGPAPASSFLGERCGSASPSVLPATPGHRPLSRRPPRSTEACWRSARSTVAPASGPSIRSCGPGRRARLGTSPSASPGSGSTMSVISRACPSSNAPPRGRRPPVARWRPPTHGAGGTTTPSWPRPSGEGEIQAHLV